MIPRIPNGRDLLGTAQWLVLSVLVAMLLVGAVACGRPATQGDCDFIVGRIAELELGAGPAADRALVEKQVAETKLEFQAKARRECVGKRITDRALRCVKEAKTAEEIVRQCLN